jgi:hypothetical protein
MAPVVSEALHEQDPGLVVPSWCLRTHLKFLCISMGRYLSHSGRFGGLRGAD